MKREAKLFLDDSDAAELVGLQPGSENWANWFRRNQTHVMRVIHERIRIQAYIDTHLCRETGLTGLSRRNPLQRWLARMLFAPEWRRIREKERELDELNAAFRARLDASSTPEQRERKLSAALGLKSNSRMPDEFRPRVLK